MRTGSSIAHYEIGDLLGQGGMGEVYLARDSRLDRPVALKFLARRFVSDPDAKARFIREAKAASALDHPNICTIHDIGETDDGELYLVMAFYEGRTLEARLRDESFPVERTVGIIRQLARALKRAHEGGIVHRDVKPANTMVGKDDAVRLLDFGVAKLQSANTMTQTGTTLGTAGYMSPEQGTGEAVTPASDVWSLGVMAYQMLAGRRPFEADQPLALLNRIVTADPDPLQESAPGTPDEIAAVIHQALAKDPADRFPDAAAFLQALDDASGVVEPATAPGRVATGAKGTRTWAAPAAAGVVTVAALAAVWFSVRAPDSPGDAADMGTDDVLAVLPFTVTGSPELDYLSEGLIHLVGGRLDGAGTLRTVDPRAVLGQGPEADLASLDLEGSSELAATVGAGRFVTGQVVGLPDRLSLSARLYRTGALGEDPPVVTVEGSADSLFALVDQLATGLLETSMTGANARIQQRAARSSGSLQATKEFLRGEQFHRRGQFDSASAAYNRALEFDTTFALAHLMKSMNNAYTYDTDDYVAAVKAMEYSEGLPDRDQSLIKAFLDQQAGRLEAAEQAYLAHLKRYPDEVKALLQMGMLYQRSNPRWGRPIDQANGYYEQVLQLEPENVPALHRGARLDAVMGRYDRLEERARILERVAPESEWAVDAATMAAFARGDRQRIDALTAEFAGESLLVRVYAIYNALRFSDDPSEADRLIERQAEGTLNTDTGLPDNVVIGDDLTVWGALLTDVVRGRYGQVATFLADRSDQRTAAWDIWRAEMVAADLIELDPSLLEELLARVQAVDPVDRMRNPFEPLHDVFTPAVGALERDVSVARLLGRLGRFDEAWAIQRDIETRPPYEAFESLREDAAGGLAADLLHLEGRDREALEILRTLPFQVPNTASSLSITTGSHARFLRAQLEFAMGDTAVARYLFEGFVHGFSPADKIFLASAYEQLGRIHEAAGRRAEAIFYYQKLAGAWEAADAALQPRREAALARLAALRATDGP
jgi:tetratricopeptide (TPR) repeat protein